MLMRSDFKRFKSHSGCLHANVYNMIKTLFLVSIYLLIASTSALAAAQGAYPPATVSYEGHSLIYRGYLSSEGNQRLKRLYETLSPAPQNLLIESRGGEINLGMDLGEWVLEKRLNVIVDKYCLSSCANYIFTAGAAKTLHSQAVLGFHGGAYQNSINALTDEELTGFFPNLSPAERLAKKQEIIEQSQAYLLQAQAREKRFFAHIGVDPRLLTWGQESLFQKNQDFKADFWDYSIPAFEKLGVKSIRILNPPWNPAHFPGLKVFRIEADQIPDAR